MAFVTRQSGKYARSVRLFPIDLLLHHQKLLNDHSPVGQSFLRTVRRMIELGDRPIEQFRWKACNLVSARI